MVSIPTQSKASGLSSNGRGMDHITTIQQDTRPCISQRQAISITTEKPTSLRSFSSKACSEERIQVETQKGKLQLSQVQND